jgi:hypothetical protein
VSDGPRLLASSILPSTSGFLFTPPKVLFERNFVGWTPTQGRSFDVAADGRFLMSQQIGQPEAAPPIVVVLNWFEELKRLVPAH